MSSESAATTDREAYPKDCPNCGLWLTAESMDCPRCMTKFPHESSAAYTEGWQGEVYRWLAKHIDRQARKLRYPSTRRGVRMWLEDVADALVWKAIERGWK